MPPRKSNISVSTSNGAEEAAETTPAKAPKDGISIEDLSLPKSMIARLAKGVLPANTQIQKDALLALHKSATVFVSHVASNSNEYAQAAGKKTIAPQDVIAALKEGEFESFLPRLEAELKKFVDIASDKRNTYRRKMKQEQSSAVTNEDGGAVDEASAVEGANGTASGNVEDVDDERPSKKMRAENGAAMALDSSHLGDDEDVDSEGDNDHENQHDEEDDDDEEDDGEDEDEGADETQDGGAGMSLVDDRDELMTGDGLRDEALDEPNSDSD